MKILVIESMNQRTNLTIVGTIALIALLVSVGGLFTRGARTTQTDALEKIVATKRMDVCVAEWPPASIKDPKTGKWSGHDIDAYNEIAKAIGAKVVYHDTTFGDMPAAIQSGVCDMGTSLFVTIGRSAAVDFTRPILYSGVSALVRRGDTRFSSVAAINHPGVTIATATGEAGDIYAKANLSQAKITSIDVDSSDLSRFMLEVSSGRADIAIADTNTITRFAAAHPEMQAIFVSEPLQLSPDAFPVRAGDQKLVDFLNNSLLTMQVSGEWKNLQEKYNAHWLQPVIEYKIQ